MNKKLVIDRATWLHGEGGDKSYLLRADGKKCCLGFLAIQNGYKEKDILEKRSPSSLRVVENLRKIWEGIIDGSWASKLGYSMMETNDGRTGMPILNSSGEMTINSDEDREKRLIKLFKQIDIDVEFVGSYENKDVN